MMAATKAMLKVCRAMSGDEFIAAYGFAKTIKAISFLIGCGDFHISYDFLIQGHAAILDEFAKRYATKLSSSFKCISFVVGR